LRNEFSEFATTSCRGLSLSRYALLPMMPDAGPVVRLLAVYALALLLAGCPPPGTTEFRNATGDPVTVRWAREQVSVPAGASVPVTSYEFPRTFEIITPYHTWHYVAKYPGQDYMAPGFRFGLRIQRDGRIYAFQYPRVKTKFSKQPDGYPLHPEA
jgi:hypothetical protein